MKVEAQPHIRSLRSASPGAEHSSSNADSGCPKLITGFPKGTLLPNIWSPGPYVQQRFSSSVSFTHKFFYLTRNLVLNLLICSFV
jgi:hypothetical protein